MSIFETMQAISDGVDKGYRRGQQNKLAQLTSGVYGTQDPNQRLGLMREMMATDPAYGMQMQDRIQKQDDDYSQKLAGAANYIINAHKSGNQAAVQGAYSATKDMWQRFAAQQGIDRQVPDQFDENMMPVMHQIVAAAGGQLSGQEGAEGRVVGNALVDPYTGKVLYQGEQQSKPQLVQDSEGNYYSVDPQNPGSATPVTFGGGSHHAGAASQVMADAYQDEAANFDDLTKAVMMQESGGNHSAVSPAGARGLMQLMPATATAPGYGISPASDDSPQENMRVGREYLGAMLNKYGGDQMLALAAYNAGPGRVDQALKASGGNPRAALSKLPTETQNYVKQVPARIGIGSAGQGKQLRGAPKKTQQDESYGQPQDVVGPDGKTRLVQFGNRGGYREVSEFAAKPDKASSTSQLTPQDASKARQKLVQINVARNQIKAVRSAFDKIKNSYSAGILGNHLPTPEGQAFDRSVANLKPLISAITRVPGVGSMSDYETRLQESGMPSRGTYEQVTEQQLNDLESLLDGIDGGYKDLLGGDKSPPPKDGAGWSMQRVD